MGGHTSPEYPYMHTGTYKQGHDTVQAKRDEVLATCHGLIMGSLRQTRLLTADQR